MPSAAIAIGAAKKVIALGSGPINPAEVAQRHLISLESLDRWSQQLVQLAIVISADDPIAAAEKVTLRELRDQLRKIN